MELSTSDKISTVGVFNSFKNGPGVSPFYRIGIMLLKGESSENVKEKRPKKRTEMPVRYVTVQKLNNVEVIRNSFRPNRYCFLHFCILVCCSYYPYGK